MAGAVEPFGLRAWTFITSHAQVLLALARDPEATVAEVARAAQITERSSYVLSASSKPDTSDAARSVGATATRSTRAFGSATRFWRTTSFETSLRSPPRSRPRQSLSDRLTDCVPSAALELTLTRMSRCGNAAFGISWNAPKRAPWRLSHVSD